MDRATAGLCRVRVLPAADRSLVPAEGSVETEAPAVPEVGVSLGFSGLQQVSPIESGFEPTVVFIPVGNGIPLG